jgi:hypothetical protein
MRANVRHVDDRQLQQSNHGPQVLAAMRLFDGGVTPLRFVLDTVGLFGLCHFENAIRAIWNYLIELGEIFRRGQWPRPLLNRDVLLLSYLLLILSLEAALSMRRF